MLSLNIQLKFKTYDFTWIGAREQYDRMSKAAWFRVLVTSALTLSAFAAQNGGAYPVAHMGTATRAASACPTAPPGAITNTRGEVLFISENATDRGEALQEAVSEGVRLHNASLAGAQLRDIRLSGADLAGADFRGAVLDHVDLSHADLSHANFKGAKLQDVKYRHAKLHGSTLAISHAESR